MISLKKAAVIGAGSWGTAFSQILSDPFDEVFVWDIDEKHLIELETTRENKKYLPGISLAPNVRFLPDLKEVMAESSIIVLAFPSVFVRETLKKIKKHLQKTQKLVNLIKGIELKTLNRVSEIVLQEMGEVGYAVFSGPSHAEEVAQKMPTAIVCASEDEQMALDLQKITSTDYFRVYTSDDVCGVELGGSLKNIMAIAAGISDGLGYGSNTKAAIMTRGINEIARFASRFNARPFTFLGLSGIGDLITTCISAYSRNRRYGEMIGKGAGPEEALTKMTMVVEGRDTAEAVGRYCIDKDIDMPITMAVYNTIFKNLSPQAAVKELMRRDIKPEKI